MMKRLITLLIITSILLLPTQQIQSSILIQIEVGDSWVYNISGVGDVDFDASDLDYIEYGSEQLRVNKILSTVFVEHLKFFEVLTDNYLVDIETFSDDTVGEATMRFVGGGIDDVAVWRTSRGNLLYNMQINGSLVIQFSDISYNGTDYPNYQVSVDVTLNEWSSNPEIIETVATGIVKISTRTIEIEGIIEDTDFLNFGLGVRDIPFFISFYFEERYEASDGFIYEETNCRNITVTPLEGFLAYEYMDYTADTYIDAHTFNGPISLGTISNFKEDWIYAYDAGLPLEIVQTLVSGGGGGTVKQQVTETTTMTLVDLDVTNSNFTFPEEPTETPEPTKTLSPAMTVVASLMMVTAILMYFQKPKKK